MTLGCHIRLWLASMIYVRWQCVKIRSQIFRQLTYFATSPSETSRATLFGKFEGCQQSLKRNSEYATLRFDHVLKLLTYSWDRPCALLLRKRVTSSELRRNLPVKGQGKPNLTPSLGSQGKQSKLSSKRFQAYCQTKPIKLKAMKRNDSIKFASSGPLVTPACEMKTSIKLLLQERFFWIDMSYCRNDYQVFAFE